MLNFNCWIWERNILKFISKVNNLQRATKYFLAEIEGKCLKYFRNRLFWEISSAYFLYNSLLNVLIYSILLPVVFYW